MQTQMTIKRKILIEMSFWTHFQMDYITNFYAGWRDLMDNKADQRTSEWFLMSSPFPTIAISLTYAYFVKVSRLRARNKLSWDLFWSGFLNFDLFRKAIGDEKFFFVGEN